MGESVVTNIIGFVNSNLTISVIFGLLVLVYILFELFNWLSNNYITDSGVTVNKLIELLNHENAIVIDIRDLDSYHGGHIISATQINATDCNSEHKLIKSNVNNKRPIIIVDENGREAAACTGSLSKSGIKKVLYLQGGISAWKSSNMPLITSKVNKNIMNNKITIYTKDACPYCVSAKNLLQSKGQSFQEIKISDVDAKEFQDMLKLSGGLKTVPQIFIADKHIGGFDALKALNDKGELDNILKNI
jgi:glutaredoxin 3